ncbi:MAG: GNAT family N-acetyltransferase [Actinobacteria bacterium]|nr:GNAT family N-acetyltransferase [Actinomycetota bacterium]
MELPSAVDFSVEDPASHDGAFCLSAYYSELHERFDGGFDIAGALADDPDGLRPPAGLFVVARHDAAPVGCGGLKFDTGVPAYIKRMWISPTARGQGVGRLLLAHLEDLARDLGHQTVHLETNRNLAEAIRMYRMAGYEEIPPFNDEPYAHHWFRKHLE